MKSLWSSARAGGSQREAGGLATSELLLSSRGRAGAPSKDEGREKQWKSFMRLSKLRVGMRRLLPVADCMKADGVKIFSNRGNSLSFRARDVDRARVVAMIRELPYEDNPGGHDDIGDVLEVVDDEME